MSGGYQHLQKYKGSLYGNLNYSGIEYDYEVPDNVVIASPGGVSGIHHHYTKGMYSDASSHVDIHAGEKNYDGYPYGEYGNMYQMGQSATRVMGDFVPPSDLHAGNSYTENQSQIRKENYTHLPPNMELVPPPQDEATNIATPILNSTPLDVTEATATKKISFENILKVLAIFSAGYLTIAFLQKGGENFVSTKFYGDKPLTWKEYCIMAAVSGSILLCFSYFFNISLKNVEKKV